MIFIQSSKLKTSKRKKATKTSAKFDILMLYASAALGARHAHEFLPMSSSLDRDDL